MTYQPIQRLEVAHYGCIRKANFALTPLHALIGPNDSGKSTVLRALRTVAQFGYGDCSALDSSPPSPFDPLVDSKNDSTSIGLHYPDGLAYVIRVKDGGIEEIAYEHGRVVGASQGLRSWNHPGLLEKIGALPVETAPATQVSALQSRLTAATMVRFDPDYLRAPAKLIPESQGIAFADERGTGLASVFDSILNRDSEAFAQIQANVRSLFPSVAKVGLINVSNSQKEIAVTLADGTRVGAKAMSEGLLYYLGFAALSHIDDSRLYLVEEPENGLHPARIAEVMAVLREISKTSQVVIATHSPLVVNELRGDEISVVTRNPQDGTRAVLLKDVPGFEDASKVYQNGELWVSYADGRSEEPLLTGTARS